MTTFGISLRIIDKNNTTQHHVLDIPTLVGAKLGTCSFAYFSTIILEILSILSHFFFPLFMHNMIWYYIRKDFACKASIPVSLEPLLPTHFYSAVYCCENLRTFYNLFPFFRAICSKILYFTYNMRKIMC